MLLLSCDDQNPPHSHRPRSNRFLPSPLRADGPKKWGLGIVHNNYVELQNFCILLSNCQITPENSLQHGSRTVRCLLMCGARSLSLGVWWADRAAYRGKHLHSRGRARGTRTRNRGTNPSPRTTNTPCLSTRHPTWRFFLSSSARAAAASRPFGGTERRRAVGSLGSVSKAREVGWEMGTSRRRRRL